jgi:hypothetical protein
MRHMMLRNDKDSVLLQLIPVRVTGFNELKG